MISIIESGRSARLQRALVWQERVDALPEAELGSIISTIISALQPAVIDAGKRATRQIGSKYRREIKAKGAQVAEDAIFKMLEPYPFIRDYVSPEYKPGKPLPGWVKEMSDPILKPFADGVKEVAIKKGKKLETPLIIAVSTTFAIAFIGGILVGRWV